jgi:NAD(P)-dependent dehydrogenase (short-subunit alcohol dehydrogenase family)
LEQGPIQGVFWLPALDDEGSLSEMDLGAWRNALHVRVKLLYTTMRALFEHGNAFLVSATKLGGFHGYEASGATQPLGGAVTGFTKTYKREKADSLVKAVDFPVATDPAEIAQLLLDETERDPGAVEIGYRNGLRWTVGLIEEAVADGQPGLTLNKDSVFVITGAAGSIVSAITTDLAAASGGTFYLLDLVPEPDPNNSDLKRMVADREGLKRDIHARIKASGKRATPALVEKEMEALERAQAAQAAIDAVRNAGGTPYYFSVNVLDSDSVTNVIDQVRARSGRIDVLLHAAGLERSHFLPDKPANEFDLVFDVKSDGWFNLLKAIGDMPLGATVAFSSIAGRFGNGGQSDYSAANDLLCKISSSFRTTRPQTRGIALDWTAWGGIGMATRGSIPKMMEMAGIDMLAPEAGVPWIRRELTEGGTRGEVVVARRLGILLKEFDPTGGLDVNGTTGKGHTGANGPMIGHVVACGLHTGLTVDAPLDPNAQAFLFDHQIEGKPVLPGVMGMEGFAEAVKWMLPSWRLDALEQVELMAPFKLYRGQPRPATIEAVFRPDGNDVVAECKLTGSRVLPGQTEPQVTTHFTGRARLTRRPVEDVTGEAPLAPTDSSATADLIYKLYFHGPAYRVLDSAWKSGEQMIGRMAENLQPNHYPPELPVVMSPRAIELCLQTAGIWEMAFTGRMALPLHADSVKLFRSSAEAPGPLFAVATPRQDGAFDVDVTDNTGLRYIRLTGYRTIVHPDGVNAEPLQALQAAVLHLAATHS